MGCVRVAGLVLTVRVRVRGRASRAACLLALCLLACWMGGYEVRRGLGRFVMFCILRAGWYVSGWVVDVLGMRCC